MTGQPIAWLPGGFGDRQRPHAAAPERAPGPVRHKNLWNERGRAAAPVIIRLLTRRAACHPSGTYPDLTLLNATRVQGINPLGG